MQIIDYQILACTESRILVQDVKEAIKNGWQPFGSMTCTVGKDDSGDILWEYCQPIVKYS